MSNGLSLRQTEAADVLSKAGIGFVVKGEDVFHVALQRGIAVWYPHAEKWLYRGRREMGNADAFVQFAKAFAKPAT